jgi:hypothetical protein
MRWMPEIKGGNGLYAEVTVTYAPGTTIQLG